MSPRVEKRFVLDTSGYRACTLNNLQLHGVNSGITILAGFLWPWLCSRHCLLLGAESLFFVPVKHPLPLRWEPCCVYIPYSTAQCCC